MKFKFLIMFFFLAACQNEEINKLKKDIFELRTEIREIAQLKYEVQELKNNSKSEAPAPTNNAIIPKTLKSSGNELDDPFLGEKTTEHVVMFFTDYQCKLCSNFIQTNLEKLKQDYISNKKIKFIFRDYPLSTNSKSVSAANFANCAGEQGKYWEASDALIKTPELLDQAKYDVIAKTLKGLDTKKLLRCTNRSRYEKEIELDRQDAKEIGVTGIPSFFLGKISNAEYAGFLVRGAQPYNVLKSYIDKVLESE